MNRQAARINTIQSINAKASQMEMDEEILCESQNILSDTIQIDGRPEPYFAADDLVSYAINHLVEKSWEMVDTLETVAAFLTLAAQKEREKNAQGS